MTAAPAAAPRIMSRVMNESSAGALQQVAVSAAAVHVVPAQSALSLLESLTFGAVHELSVEHLALAVDAGDGTTAGAVLQHVDASAAVVHVVPAQSVLFLLESLTFGAVQDARLEHLALATAVHLPEL